MGCYFEMDNIEIPQSLAAQVEELIKKHELDGTLQIDHYQEHYYIQVQDGSMAWSTSSDIQEKFFPDVAKLLKGMEFDGQAIITEVDDEPATNVFLNGEARGWSGRREIADCAQVAEGQEADVQLPHHVLGLGNGKVLILK